MQDKLSDLLISFRKGHSAQQTLITDESMSNMYLLCISQRSESAVRRCPSK